MAYISGKIFESLLFDRDYQQGGAILQSETNLTITDCSFDNNGGQVYSTYGGAISFSGDAEGKTLTISNTTFSNNYAHHGGAINAPEVINLTNVTFTGNHADPGYFAGYGGAVFIQGCQELNYTVTSGNNIVNQGNTATVGGFLHDHEGRGIFTFNVEADASLTIGSRNTSTDSINLHKGSKLIKTGNGTMVINSELERRHPYTAEGTCTDGDITIEGGVLELNRGGTFDGTVKISGGQLKLGANYSFNSVEFELKSTSPTAFVYDWSKISTSVIKVDIAEAQEGSYVLAANASGFNRSITITNNVSNSTLSCGGSVTIDQKTYSLDLSGSNLILNVVNGRETASLVVTTAADIVDANDGVISLREAVAYAQTLDGKQTITFNIGSGDSVTLSSVLNIASDILIDGTNAASGSDITLKTAVTYAESLQNSSSASNYTLLNVTADNFGLRSITIKGGQATAVTAESSVQEIELQDVVFSDSYKSMYSLAQNVSADNIYSVNCWEGMELGKNFLISNSTFDGSNLQARNEINGGFVLIADGTKGVFVNTTLLNNEVDHSGAALYIGSGSNITLVNTTIDNARGYLGYGNTLCSVLGGSFHLLNSIVVTPDGWRTPDIGAAFGSSNTIRNSVYGTTSSSNSAVNSYTGYDSEEIFVTPGETNENKTLTLRDDATVLNNAVLAAVDPETLTVYYSEDNGSSWKRLSDNAAANVESSWIIDRDQNGNSRLNGTNKIGAVITTGEGSGTLPQPPVDEDDNHSFETAVFLGTDEDIRSFNNASLPVSYEQDYYKFTLTAKANVTLTTSGTSGDTVMYLYDGNRSQIASNDDGGDGYFSRIETTLEAGTYYVKINAYSSGTVSNYALTPQIQTAETQSLVVTTAEDVVDASDGVTSLREALAYAQSLGNAQTITFNVANSDTFTCSEFTTVTAGITLDGQNLASGNQMRNRDGIIVSNGAMLKNYTVFYPNTDRSPGDIWLEVGSFADNITVSTYGDFYATGSTVSNTNVDALGKMTVYNSQINNLDVDYQGVLVYSTENLFTGNITIAGAAIRRQGNLNQRGEYSSPLVALHFTGNASQVNKNTNITLDFSSWTPGVQELSFSAGEGADNLQVDMMLQDMGVFTGAGSYTLQVNVDQTLGVYKIAGNAADFNSRMSLKVGENTYENVLQVGGSYSVNGVTYALGKDSSNTLTLTVSDGSVVVPPRDDNHSFATAIDLGRDSAIRTFTGGALPVSYEEDYYSFTLTQGGVITLTTSGNNGGDTILRLYDSSQNEIAYNDDGNGYFSKITQTLSAGTYYVKVSAYSSGTVSDYTLTPEICIPETQSLVVTTAEDVVNASDGVVSLREAISYAQQLGGTQTITFNIADTDILHYDFTVSGTITVCGINQATGNRIKLTNSIDVSNGATLTDFDQIFTETHRAGGDIYGYQANCERLSVADYADFLMYDSNINDLHVKAEGQVLIYSSDINNITVDYQGILVYSLNNAFAGDIVVSGALTGQKGGYPHSAGYTIPSFTGNASQISSSANLTLDLYHWSPGGSMVHHPNDAEDRSYGTYGCSCSHSVLIENMAVFTGAGSYTVSVKTDQAAGTYKLAGNAANFNAAMSLTVGENTYENALQVGGSYSVNGVTYALGKDSSNTLTLTVSDGSVVVPPRDDNHSFATAIDLGRDSAIRTFTGGALPVSYEEDYYSFTLTQGGVITLTTSGNNGGDTILRLYDSSQNEIAYNDDGNGYFSKITQTLSAGTYYVKVSAYSSGTVSDYTLTPEICIPETQSLVVTTAEDVVDASDGVTSLREAIAYAATLNGEQTITFAGDYTIALNSTLNVLSDIVIDGGNNEIVITIDSSELNVFELTADSFKVNNIDFLATNQNGEFIWSEDYYDGGRLISLRQGSFYLSNSSVEGFKPGNSIVGGENTYLQIDNCFLANNVGSSQRDFRSYYANGGVLILGNALINNTTFTGNTAGVAGGVFVGETGNANIVNCSFVNNSAHIPYYGISVHNQGNLYVQNSIIVDNSRSSLAVDQNMYDPYLVVRNSIFSSVYANRASGNISEKSTNDIYANLTIDVSTDGNKYLEADQTKVKDNAILSAVDENNVLFYSSDGVVWYKTSDNSAASDELNRYLSQHILGNRTAENNIVGVQFSQETIIKPPTPPVVNTDPDDQISEAPSLVSVLEGVIDREQDVDIYQFTVAANEKIILQTSEIVDGLTLDSYIRLFDANGNELAANDDGGLNHYSLLNYTFREAGTYYVGVSHYANAHYNAVTGENDKNGKTGDYKLTLVHNGFVDSNDQTAEASELVVDREESGTIAYASDVNMYKFAVEENDIRKFVLSGVDVSETSAFMRVFDANGRELVSGNGELEYTFRSAGTYYIGISGAENREYNAVSGGNDTATSVVDEYTLSMHQVSRVYQDDDDTFAEAVSAANSGVITGAIEADTDVDMYKFNVSEGEEFTVNISDFAETGNFMTTLKFFDSNGNVLAQSDARKDSMVYRFSEAGTVYMGVSDDGNTAYDPVGGSGDVSSDTGTYSLTVLSRNIREVLLSSAIDLGAVTASGPVVDSTSISNLSDIDMYSFTVNAGDEVWIDLDNLAGSRLDSYFRLFDSQGNVLGSNDDGAAASEDSRTCESYLEYTFSTGGRYYLGVSSYGNHTYDVSTNALIQTGENTGSYRLAFGMHSADADPDDTLATATALSSGDKKRDSIDNGCDVDMYKIYLNAGDTVKAAVSLQGLQDSYLRLFDSNGNELLSNDDISSRKNGRNNGKASQITWQAREAGIYYFGVSGYGNVIYDAVTGEQDVQARYTGNYTISVDVESGRVQIADDIYEDNDTMADAADLGVRSGNSNITGLTMNDAADWYSFTLNSTTGAGSEVRLTANQSHNLAISVYDSYGDLLGFAASGADGVSLANLDEGDYLLKVSGNESHNYHISFKIDAPPVVSGNNSENYVVLFSGGYNAENNFPYYYDSIKNMYEIATGVYGVDSSHIYVLFADGTYSGADNALGRNSDMSYAEGATVLAATKSSLRNVFQNLSRVIDSNDHLLFYSFDHGSESFNGTDYLCGWNETIRDTDFAEYASWVSTGYQTYLFSQCFSGGILEDMSVSDNIFVGTASGNDKASHTDIDLHTGQAVAGFSVAAENGLKANINNTQELYTYISQNNPHGYEDGQQKAGGNFSIFAAGTNSNDVVIQEFDDGIYDNNIVSNGYFTNKNGSYIPTITALSVYAGDLYENLNSAQIGETVSVSAKALSLNTNSDISKVEFYYTDANGMRQLMHVDSDAADGWLFFWTIDRSFAAGYGTVSAVAMDSNGTYGIIADHDFQILEQNFHPDVTAIKVDSAIYYPGAAVTVSGEVTDYDNNGIDSVRIYLDSDKDGVFSYPDEFLGIAQVSSQGSWEYSFTLKSTYTMGNYSIKAEAVDSLDMLSGQSMEVSFNITDLSIRNFEVSDNSIQWKNSISDTCSIEISNNSFENVLSLNTDGSSVDIVNLKDETYQTRAKFEGGEWNIPQTIKSSAAGNEDELLCSNRNGALDIFFAEANGTWKHGYAAWHTGILNGWIGTNEQVSLTGKNKLADIFEGSSDANILVMTDDANGDALFVDDIFTALPGTIAEQQSRIAQINEIRAGLGDDIVDMTSQRFAYIGDGVKIYGGLGNDTIWANNGSNTLFGDAGNDRIVGGANNDVITGGIGNDSMHGGGGSDIFCFGSNWGVDTVEQLAGGEITLWFDSGDMSNWNADTLTYTDGANSVTVSGAASVTLKFGADSSLPGGAFADAASEKIFEDKNKGMLA